MIKFKLEYLTPLKDHVDRHGNFSTFPLNKYYIDEVTGFIIDISLESVIWTDEGLEAEPVSMAMRENMSLQVSLYTDTHLKPKQFQLKRIIARTINNLDTNRAIGHIDGNPFNVSPENITYSTDLREANTLKLDKFNSQVYVNGKLSILSSESLAYFLVKPDDITKTQDLGKSCKSHLAYCLFKGYFPTHTDEIDGMNAIDKTLTQEKEGVIYTFKLK